MKWLLLALLLVFAGLAQADESASSLYSRAQQHKQQGEYAAAEPLFARALLLREQQLGLRHAEVATTVNGLAEVHYFQGHYPEALALFKRALAIREATLGPKAAPVGESLNNLAIVYNDLGRHAEAEPLYVRALAVRRAALGAAHPDVAETLNNFANLRVDQGLYAKAEPLYRQALALYEKASGADHVSVALPLNNLAVLYDLEGQFNKAEPLYQRALALYEKALGQQHPDVAFALHYLAHVYYAQGRYALAEPPYLRGLAIYEQALGPAHPLVAGSLHSLATLYRMQGRYGEAAPAYARALAIREQALGPQHPDVALSLSGSAELLVEQGRQAEAEPLLLRALAINEKAFGSTHPEVAFALSQLAMLYRATGDYAKAEPLALRALAIREKALRPDHPDVALSLQGLADLYADSQRLPEALGFARRATSIYRRRILAGGVDETAAREARKNRAGFFQHLSLLAATNKGPETAAEALSVVQLEQASGTETAIARMAARFASGSGQLASLVRRKQEAVSSLASVQTQLVKAASKPPERRSAVAEQALRDQSLRLGRSIDALDAQLGAAFPAYQELTRPEPLQLAQVQALLGPEEAMLVYAFGGKPGGFLWVLRRDAVQFLPLAIDGGWLSGAVESIRRQMDFDGHGQALAVDLALLRQLHGALLAPALPWLQGVKHLMLVPEGPLVSLPPGLLLASPASTGDYRQADWLIRHYALSVLPSVSSIRAFRQFAKKPAQQLPFIGFGDPLLGEGSTPLRNLGLLALASPSAPQPEASGIADVEAIRRLQGLPDTAQELAVMAQTLGAGPGSLWLREQATVSRVMQSPLARYRTIAFATHGVMAAEASALGVSEPGLILTPPLHGSAEDDGYLSASRIAQLDLNADWVLLSACNTAAADGSANAEGFSGLAKAFFYAGSRSLLVSNWWVSSEATVALTTGMLGRYQSQAASGKAEALRQSMLAMIDTPARPELAHPLYWAPFVVVGEGGAAR